MARAAAWCAILHVLVGVLAAQAAEFDAVAAVQASMQVKAQATVEAELEINADLYQKALQHSRLGRAWASLVNGTAKKGGFNCTKSPGMCQPPFDCHTQVKRSASESVAKPDGHPDFQGWCNSPYEEAAMKCQQGDLEGYGRVIHKAQLDIPMLGKAIEVLDSHYCFAFGHCDNTEVTPRTTLNEAEAMCDKKFGESWRTVSSNQLGIGLFSLRPGLFGTHFSQQAERAFAEMACGMGNFHCDVIYCRQEYCHNSYFVSKYDKIRPGYVAPAKPVKAKKE